MERVAAPPVTATAPPLVELPGVRTHSAGALLVAVCDNSQRLRSEAAFAYLCGTGPSMHHQKTVTPPRPNTGGNRE
jgi:hypothetical protein